MSYNEHLILYKLGLQNLTITDELLETEMSVYKHTHILNLRKASYPHSLPQSRILSC